MLLISPFLLSLKGDVFNQAYLLRYIKAKVTTDSFLVNMFFFPCVQPSMSPSPIPRKHVYRNFYHFAEMSTLPSQWQTQHIVTMEMEHFRNQLSDQHDANINHLTPMFVGDRFSLLCLLDYFECVDVLGFVCVRKCVCVWSCCFHAEGVLGCGEVLPNNVFTVIEVRLKDIAV